MDKHILLVTGGLGFIGKHFVRRVLEQGYNVINVDHMNYAADVAANALFSEYKN